MRYISKSQNTPSNLQYRRMMSKTALSKKVYYSSTLRGLRPRCCGGACNCRHIYIRSLVNHFNAYPENQLSQFCVVWTVKANGNTLFVSVIQLQIV